MQFKFSYYLAKKFCAGLVVFCVAFPVWASPSSQVPAPYLYIAMLSQVPFSANVETSVTGSVGPYVEHEKLQVSRQRMRRALEGLNDPRAMDILISDFEHREDYGSYGLSQSLEIYWAMERPTSEGRSLTAADIDSVMERFRWRDSDWERLGNERVGGLQAIRYRKVDEQQSDTRLDAWFTANEGVLCQIEVVDSNGSAITRLTNIEAGPQPDSAFEMPESFAKVSPQAYLSWLMAHPLSELHQSIKGRDVAEAIESMGVE
ncbi:DUF4412 domain-containing protein [Vreelandella titanicae]|jgi:hypothetical protein|uniref:DUF4412 domain-containing protein n=1 Tax=Vreelandella titanicae TaxID=664683 RepID=UPI001F170698|nr:DUF4412 domain-containing protein [Halomonas titanicae]MCE7518348.1 DUF4412 domain-containing protein [Halomonas titanicae]